MAKKVDYAFRLCLGENITSATLLLDEFILDQRGKTPVEIKKGEDKGEYTISLQGVKFNRNIYHPGEIAAEVEIGKGNNGAGVMTQESINQLFLQRRVKLYIMKATKDIIFADFSDFELIADNYFVHEVLPQLRTQSDSSVTMSVKLKIYSMDKLMTLNKYSKAYVAKKLGEGILAKEGKSFGFQKLMFDINTKDMRQLVYKVGDAKYEFVQPYLVQYNESFYDFMVRTANRCGEFLYFEDGKLNLGLTVRTHIVEKEDSDGKIYKVQEDCEPVEINNYTTVTYQSVSGGPLATQGYGYDSVKDDNGQLADDADTHCDSVKTDASGYPKGVFPEKLSYDIEYKSDDYVYPLFKDKFAVADDYGDGFGLQLLGKVLENSQEITDIPEMVLQLTIDAAFSKWDSYDKANKANSKGNKKLGDSQKNLYKEQYKENEEYVMFASQHSEGWTTVNYYDDIRKKEEEVQGQTICIDLGTQYMSLKLGDKIKVKGMTGTFIVVQVKLVAGENWNREYERYGEENAPSDIYTKRQSMKVYAVPVLTGADSEEIIIPPLLPVPVIRHSGTQSAFVVDSSDPKDQGRVRLAFPWQSIAKMERKELSIAEKKLQETTDAEKESIKKVENNRKKLKNLRRLRQFFISIEEDALKDESLQPYLQEMNEKKKKLSEKKCTEKEFKAAKDAYEKQKNDIIKNSLEEKVKGQLAVYNAELEDINKQLETLKAKYEENQKKVEGKKEELKNCKNPKKEAVLMQEIAGLNVLISEYPAAKTALEERKNGIDDIKKILDQKNYEDTVFTAKIENTGLIDSLKNILSKEDIKKVNNILLTEKSKKDKENKIKELIEKAKAKESVKSHLDNGEYSKAVNQLDKQIEAAENTLLESEKVKIKETKTKEEAEKEIEKAREEVGKTVKKEATPWVRLATPMATQGGGLSFTPFPGDEVLVDFENGNIERPYVVGSLYSKTQNIPGNMTLMSPNGQFMEFQQEDDGSKFVQSFLPGLKGLKTLTNIDITPKADKTLAGGISFGDKHGMFEVSMSTSDRSININSPFGVVNMSAFTGITISAPNGDINIEGKNVSISAGNNLKLNSGGNCGVLLDKWAKDYWDNFSSSLKGTIVTGILDAAQMGVAGVLKHYGIDKILAPVDFKMLRSITEIFLRPIEGTLCIKSNNYMILEAGKGKTVISPDRFSASWQKYQGLSIDKDKQLFYKKVNTYLSKLDKKVDDFYEGYDAQYKNAVRFRKVFVKNMEPFMKKDKEVPVINVIKKAWAAYTGPDAEFKPYSDGERTIKLDDFWVVADVVEFPDAPVPGELGNPFMHKPSGMQLFKPDKEKAQKYMSIIVDEFAKSVFEIHKIVAGENDMLKGIVRGVNETIYGAPAENHFWVEDWIDTAFRVGGFDSEKVVNGSENNAANGIVSSVVQALGGADDTKEGDPRTQVSSEKVKQADATKDTQVGILFFESMWVENYLTHNEPNDNFDKLLKYDTEERQYDLYGSSSNKYGFSNTSKKTLKRMIAARFIYELYNAAENKYPAAPAAPAAPVENEETLANKALGVVAKKIKDNPLADKPGKYLTIKFTKEDISYKKLESDYNWSIIASMNREFSGVSGLVNYARPLLEKIIYGGISKKWNPILGKENFGAGWFNSFKSNWNRALYNDKTSGQILFSAKKGQTLTFSDKGQIQADENNYDNSVSSLKKKLASL